MGRGRGGAERASAPSALFSALWALACGETRHARGPSAWGVCRPQPAGRLLTLQVEGGVPSRRPLSLKLSLRPLGMGPMTSTGWAHHGGLPLKDAPRRLEETWGTRGSPPSWCCLSARAASPSPQRESATSRHLTPEPVLAMGPPSHSALHPGGLSPHREARSPGWPEVAPGDLGARGLQFRVGGPRRYPKEATQQHADQSAGPPAFPGLEPCGTAHWSPRSPLVCHQPGLFLTLVYRVPGMVGHLCPQRLLHPPGLGERGRRAIRGGHQGSRRQGRGGFAGHFYRGPRERHAGLAGQLGPSCLRPAVTRGFSRGLDGHGQLCGRTAAEGGSSPRRALSVGGPKRLAERPQPACGGRLGNLAARRQRAGGTHPRAAGPDHGRGGTVSVLGD